MTGKWMALIVVFVVVMVGLVGSAFVLNWLTARFVGGPSNPQQSQVSDAETRKQRGEEYKERQEAYKAKLRERSAKTRHSTESIAKVAHEATPHQLSVSEFDPRSGKVAWPDVLKTSDYVEPREKLNRLLQFRATSPGGNDSSEAQEAAEEMLSILKENIRNVPAGDYVAARKFLESLEYILRP